MDNEIPYAIRNLIIDSLFKTQKIDAIRHLRMATNLGLREAKDVIDTMVDRMANHPGMSIDEIHNLINELAGDKAAMVVHAKPYDEQMMLRSQQLVVLITDQNKLITETNNLLRDILYAMQED